MVFILPLLIHIALEVLAREIQQEKNEDTDGKGRSKILSTGGKYNPVLKKIPTEVLKPD